MVRRAVWSALLLALCIPWAQAQAQIEDNLSTYTGQNAKGYLMPLKEGFGAGLNTGMFRSAHIPKVGFMMNLELKTTFVKFGDDERVFMARTEDGFFPSQEVEAPTVVGATEAASLSGQGGATAVFPGGFDIGSLGLAVPQLTIGNVLGTQAMIRWIAVETGEAEIGDVSLLGFGARHSISQYLVGLPLDLSVGGLYQKFELGQDLIDAKALTLGVQASKALNPILEPYVGLSYDRFEMSVAYETEATEPPTKIDVDFGSSSTVRMTGGLGINLTYVHIHGEINLADQTSYLLGLSLGN